MNAKKLKTSQTLDRFANAVLLMLNSLLCVRRNALRALWSTSKLIRRHLRLS